MVTARDWEAEIAEAQRYLDEAKAAEDEANRAVIEARRAVVREKRKLTLLQLQVVEARLGLEFG